MEGRPSWEVTRYSASQKFAKQNDIRKFHFRSHTIFPPVPILRQINPFHDFPSYFTKINIDFIFISTLTSTNRSLSFWIHHQNPARASPQPPPPQYPQAPPISFFFIWSPDIWWAFKITTRLLTQFSAASCHFFPLTYWSKFLVLFCFFFLFTESVQVQKPAWCFASYGEK